MTSIRHPLWALILAASPVLALEASDPRTCAVGDIGCESGFNAPPPLGTDKDTRVDPDRAAKGRQKNLPVAFGPAGGTMRGTQLQPGAALYGRSNDYLRSSNVMFRMQSDCNLVAYRYPTDPVWASHTDKKGTDCRAVMQADGNLVVYTGAGKALWASATTRYPGSRLAVQDDGNVVIYTGTQPRWATNTMIRH